MQATITFRGVRWDVLEQTPNGYLVRLPGTTTTRFVSAEDAR